MDNVEILKSIARVREELKIAHQSGTKIQQLEVFKRLITLYASLNTGAENDVVNKVNAA